MLSQVKSELEAEETSLASSKDSQRHEKMIVLNSMIHHNDMPLENQYMHILVLISFWAVEWIQYMHHHRYNTKEAFSYILSSASKAPDIISCPICVLPGSIEIFQHQWAAPASSTPQQPIF